MGHITVCGDGPIALSIAAICGRRGYNVRMLASGASRRKRHLHGQLPDGTSFVAPIDLVTGDAGEAAAGSDVVFVCVPHHELKATLRTLAPHVPRRALVGAVPGFGGFGLLARQQMPDVNCFFGTQRIPFVVGGQIANEGVFISGIRRQTFVGTVPAGRALAVAERIQRVLGVPTVPVSHFVNIELSPSNSIVNPARLYSLFGPHPKQRPQPGVEFFLDWDRRASNLLLALDRELQLGCRCIPRDTSFVAPILFQYDANNISTLTKRFRELHSLSGRPVPVARTRPGVLDPRTGYVREDIDFGLAIIRNLLRLSGAPTPLMDEIIEWRRRCVSMTERWMQNILQASPPAFATIEDAMTALD